MENFRVCRHFDMVLRAHAFLWKGRWVAESMSLSEWVCSTIPMLCAKHFTDEKAEAQRISMRSPSGLAWDQGQSPDNVFLLLHAVSQELCPHLISMGSNHSLSFPAGI